MDINSTVTFSNGVQIPQLGFGVFLSPAGEVTARSVCEAIEAGYRHIDTAMIYENEADVCEGIRRSGIDRKELFITTKLWNGDMRKDRVRAAFDESLNKLGMDYVDLYLVHWPVDGFEKQWHHLEDLYAAGRIRAIGISNCHAQHIAALEAVAKVKPVANQIEIHPYFSQEPLVALSREHGMLCESYSPLGGQGGTDLADPVIGQIAAAKGKTPAQVIIRWHLQRGLIVLPKSNHRERIFGNRDVFDFELSEQEMAQISALNRDQRNGGDPDNFNF